MAVKNFVQTKKTMRVRFHTRIVFLLYLLRVHGIMDPKYAKENKQPLYRRKYGRECGNTEADGTL